MRSLARILESRGTLGESLGERPQTLGDFRTVPGKDEFGHGCRRGAGKPAFEPQPRAATGIADRGAARSGHDHSLLERHAPADDLRAGLQAAEQVDQPGDRLDQLPFGQRPAQLDLRSFRSSTRG